MVTGKVRVRKHILWVNHPFSQPIDVAIEAILTTGGKPGVIYVFIWLGGCDS